LSQLRTFVDPTLAPLNQDGGAVLSRT
jgi:hypothetical protein